MLYDDDSDHDHDDAAAAAANRTDIYKDAPTDTDIYKTNTN